MKPLIIALDVDTEKESFQLIRATKKFADIYKVGPPLLMKYGPPILKKIRAAGKKVFLDLKFHDIPNTMLRSFKEVAAYGVFSATIHTSAGESAMKTVAAMGKRPKVWGVTVLTSLSGEDLSTLGFSHAPLDQTLRLALLAKRCQLDGVVASVGEAAQLRQALGTSFSIITPGIRLPDNEIGDQKRVATPQHARESGADFIVVGRPIIESKKPEQVAEEILRDWNRK
jgi:orotidine-5'-phosphate decarboxylase